MPHDNDSTCVYRRVKACILAHEVPSGKRIQIELLADRLSVSHTPVREALVRLAAERLINEVPKAGYFAKEPSESVPQDTVLFNDTIRYNIGFGRPDACFSDIGRAARFANIHERTMEMPDGYKRGPHDALLEKTSAYAAIWRSRYGSEEGEPIEKQETAREQTVMAFASVLPCNVLRGGD